MDIERDTFPVMPGDLPDMSVDVLFQHVEECGWILHAPRYDRMDDNVAGAFCQLMDVTDVVMRTDEHMYSITAKVSSNNWPEEHTITVVIDKTNKRIQETSCRSDITIIEYTNCVHVGAFIQWLIVQKSPSESSDEVEDKSGSIQVWKPFNPKIFEHCKRLMPPRHPNDVNIHLGSYRRRNYATPSQTVNDIPSIIENPEFIRKFWDALSDDEKYYEMPEDFLKCSMYVLMNIYHCNEKKTDVDRFLSYTSRVLTRNICEEIEEETMYQGFYRVWLEIRYGRLTTLDFYQAAVRSDYTHSFSHKCVVNYNEKSCPNLFMITHNEETRDLVFKAIHERTSLEIRKSGVVLNSEYPFLMASPDGVGDDVVVHIGMADASTFDNYQKIDLSTSTIANLQMEMLVCQKTFGYYCLLHPEFEKTQEMKIFEEDLNMDYILPLVVTAKTAWMKDIFPILLANS